MRHFTFSFIFTAIALALVGAWGFHLGGMPTALTAMTLAAVLAAMEVSLSFDNAVVNAGVLKTMNHFWRIMFLTVGILVAVFGMRLLFPIMIVSVAAEMSMGDVVRMALEQPDAYAARLTAHHAEVSAFGGMFLLLVFLNYFFDDEKETHWFHWLESRLGGLGRINAIGVLVALLALMVSLRGVGEAQRLAVLLAGIWGILTYLLVDCLAALLEQDEDSNNGQVVRRAGLGAFMYLEVLDASFSFDGVIGAFAITKDIVIIMSGLGIGAMFVRSITIYLVEKGTLDEYVFLEHGAHYAIGALALIMLASMKWHIPELFTGLIGIALIVLSVWSSIRYSKTQAAN
ncbi:DUF475 domain-containing protein [Rivihabitans pingtungensis]|uniref:DUF475 domain-containing protein n=1 Tax=Rivihabitans pingtungensis TaxID=1054498 RepID=A0A318LE02_9NEIS|nr:DUF475 domain-containing protein [Rivihabitans pingtungensis]PXX79877.1 hypothetical protein DFR34_10576 [Rivihabitans pingtungensis]